MPELQFVNTTSTTTINESSKRIIRRHAARQRPKLSSRTPVALVGQFQRLKLGPQSLQHTSNQPRQVSQKFTILSLSLDEKPPSVSATLASRPSPGTASRSQAASKSNQSRIAKEEDEDDVFSGSIVHAPGGRDQEEALELVGWAAEQHKAWLDSLLALPQVTLYGPSSSAMDPFNSMALAITPREQVLIRYYCKSTSEHAQQIISPLIPYCQVWFGLAVQDKALFHSVLSHYSVTYRMQFQNESPLESINHLSAAIQILNKRLQNQKESCSNGTIGAVASLILYESFDGALPTIELHMRGLAEMVRRRGGYKQANFPLDLKRLISWTDINSANDLWKPPRFPALQPPATTDPTSETGHIFQQSRNSELQGLRYTMSSPLDLSSKPSINIVLNNLRSITIELKVVARSITSLNHPRMEISDGITVIERQIFDLVHSPAAPQNTLEHASAVAALIYIRTNVRNTVCNFRSVESAKLQTALQSIMELADLWTREMEIRSRETLVWTVSFGAMSSAGRPERPWFVRLFKGLCDTLGLQEWQDVKEILKAVLWQDKLDDSGVELWEEMQRIERDWNLETNI